MKGATAVLALLLVAVPASPAAPASTLHQAEVKYFTDVELLDQAAELRGRRIYRTGESASGRAIVAVVAEADLPASSLPCASCHGPEGRGVPEGTIEPADVRWTTLSRALMPERGRIRPRYDDALLHRAITKGVDARGTALSPVMPRYRMHEDDLGDLVAYLHRLGETAQPGLRDDEIRVATVVPLSGPHAGVGALTRDVIAGYFDEVNASGGIYGRRLRLEAVDAAGADAPTRIASTFAVVCSSVEVDASERVPVITPFAAASAPASFYLYADLETQALSLARSLGEGKRQIVIHHDGSAAATAAADALSRYAESRQWTVGSLTAAPHGDALFLLGAIDPAAVSAQLERLDWHPHFLAAGTATNHPLFASGRDVSIALPTLPTDITAEARRQLDAFAERHALPADHLATRIATAAAVTVLLEGLKRAGRDLTREGLITALEGLYAFPTALTPPITFTRDRHVGASGAHVISLDRGSATFVALTP